MAMALGDVGRSYLRWRRRTYEAWIGAKVVGWVLLLLLLVVFVVYVLVTEPN